MMLCMVICPKLRLLYSKRNQLKQSKVKYLEIAHSNFIDFPILGKSPVYAFRKSVRYCFITISLQVIFLELVSSY